MAKDPKKSVAAKLVSKSPNDNFCQSYDTIDQAASAIYSWISGKDTKYIPPGLLKQLKNCNCVVFDIDDTIVRSNTRLQNQYVSGSINQLYKYVVKVLKWNVYFVTAREESKDNREYTIKQLYDMGFIKYKKLFLMPPNSELTSTQVNFSAYKYLVRAHIENQLYDAKKQIYNKIGLNMGDNFCDLLLFLPFEYWPIMESKSLEKGDLNKIKKDPPKMNKSQTKFHDNMKLVQKMVASPAFHNSLDSKIIFGLPHAVLSVKLPHVK